MARKSELAERLKWEDSDFEQRWVKLFTRKRKNGELQVDYMPMNDNLYRILKEPNAHRDGSSNRVFNFTDYQLKKLMGRLCDKAGLKRFGFHAIRHFVASKINNSGRTTVKLVQGLLRHQRQSTTENYLHILDRGLIEAMRILDED